MEHPIRNRSSLVHAKLERALYPIALRLLKTERRNTSNKALSIALLAAVGITLLTYTFPVFADYALVATFIVAAASVLFAARKEKAHTLDYIVTARAIETLNPDLKQSLVTAVELQLEGKTDFFAEQVTRKALASPTSKNWEAAGKKSSLISRIRYIGTMAGILLCMLATLRINDRSIIKENLESNDPLLAATKLLVEPGDAEVERGSSIVVTARFDGPLPQDVNLTLIGESGDRQSIAMARSLSDPVFAYSVRNIEGPLRYTISYSDQSSESYRISTYELPDLLQADATLQFPEYTGWQDRTIEDTLRISAVEGTELRYLFNANKPISSAYLIDKQGNRRDLLNSEGRANQFELKSTLSKSDTYTLHLVDAAGRSNAYPPEVRIETILNERPRLRLDAPKGDQRFTPLEEVVFLGTASDDFGLLDYGISYVLPAQEEESLSLTPEDYAPEPATEQLRHLLELENLNLEAKDTMSWYLWAKDFGPDGTIRHTTSDLYFADIRSFDEIFREQDQGGGGQGQAENQGLELLDKQRRIVISLFRIKNDATTAEGVVEDIDVLQRSQVEALKELQQLIPRLEEASAVQHAMDAQRFMEGADLGLSNAVDLPSLEPLDLAWSDAQNAYDKLVKLSDDEFNVSRSPNQQSGSGGGASRSQAQVNELDFRQEDSRYETASEAQALSSPEDRKNLELIAKLNELSRRQDDLNERLQDMQSDLANAETEEERERIARELKRLEEEQRQMLADADDAIQQAGNRSNARQARQQLEEARENMREASEQLEEGQVSQALASGTRAQDTLEKTREQMREANSSEFSEAMRNARLRARELAETQAELEEELSNRGNGEQQTLDGNSNSEELVERVEAQSESLDTLLEDVREIAEDAENVEPGLFRELYQVIRDSNGSRFEERYDNSLQYLRQGFLDEARTEQQGLTDDLQGLSEAVDQAAEGILGSEGATMEFAQSEIESLSQQLNEEREQSEPSSGQQAGNGGNNRMGNSNASRLQEALSGLGESNDAPLTGGDFGEWIERLSTVEALLEEPSVRARVSEARETAESMRRDFKRHGKLPQWDAIEGEIAVPLNEVSSWLQNELERIVNPDTLQSIDRDPVPEDYDSIVQRYYESLGND